MSIISLDSKQYIINEGEKIAVLKLGKKLGDVFGVNDLITGKELKLRVVENKKGPKTKVLKFIKNKGYKRTIGSRDHLSIVELALPDQKKVTIVAGKTKKNTTK